MNTMKRVLKASAMLCLFGMLSLIVAYAVAAAPTSDEYLLRVEVKGPHSEQVSVSAPLSLIGSLFQVLPKEIKQICDDATLTPETLINELSTMEGQDLVRIEGTEQVRVWLEAVTSDTQKDLGFIKVNVIDKVNKVNVCVPRGLVQLAVNTIKQLGLVDKYVELPREIKELAAASHENRD